MSNGNVQRKPIGSFNVFRALRLEGHEIRHSNFLGWLLDPAESHGLGDLFLRAFVKVAAPSIPDLAVTEAQVSREVDQLDIRIVLPERRLVFAIENKLFIREHSEQLRRYGDAILRDFPGWTHVLVYLTLESEAPSDPRWRPMSYRQILDIIANSQLEQPNAPDGVFTFIHHYRDLLVSIYSRRDEGAGNARLPEVLETISSALLERSGWILVARTSACLLECVPAAIADASPPIGTRRGRDPRHWLTLRFHDHGERGYVGRYWRPSDVSDLAMRNAILRQLVEREPETGFKYKAGPLDEGLMRDYPAFSGDRIQDLRTGSVPESSVLKNLIHRELGAIEARMPAILDVLQSAQTTRKP